jgi:hypothetical protein
LTWRSAGLREAAWPPGEARLFADCLSRFTEEEPF